MALASLASTSCGGHDTNASNAAQPTTAAAQPTAATTPDRADRTPPAAAGNAQARPSTTSRPPSEWVPYALPDGTAAARFPQAPETEPFDERGGSLVWAEWDGAGFAIVTGPTAPASDDELTALTATAAAAVLDGIFGVERGTVPASALTRAATPTAVEQSSGWATRSLELEGEAMGMKFLVRCRAHTNGTRLVLHLFVVEPSKVLDADAFFDTLVLR